MMKLFEKVVNGFITRAWNLQLNEKRCLHGCFPEKSGFAKEFWKIVILKISEKSSKQVQQTKNKSKNGWQRTFSFLRKRHATFFWLSRKNQSKKRCSPTQRIRTRQFHGFYHVIFTRKWKFVLRKRLRFFPYIFFISIESFQSNHYAKLSN